MKKVNIIGGGLAGLSAGIHLQQKGIRTEIFELADWAGGMCAAWTRKGYRFDGCINWMVGTKPGDSFHTDFLEVGALEPDTQIYYPDFEQFEIDGKMFTVPLKLDEFRLFLNTLAPQDGKIVGEFCDAIKICASSKMPAGSPENPGDLLRMMKESGKYLKIAGKYVGTDVKTFASRFKSDMAQKLLCRLMPPEFSMAALLMELGERMGHNAGYPMGGSLGVVRRAEAKYRALGGYIRFRSKVDEIVTENGAVKGIKTGGTFYPSDYVIAACDAYDTLNRMLGGKYPHPQLDAMLTSAPLFQPIAMVSFGLNRRFGIPYAITYECPQGIPVGGGVSLNSLMLRSFDFDPDAAPANGSSTMACLMGAPLDYWKTLRESDKMEYDRQKKLLTESVTEAVDRRIPGFRDAIVVSDVATPATYVRLANLYQGSWEGFSPTPKGLTARIKKTLPGLQGFVICGQWTGAGGGTCMAVQSGKEAAEAALKSL